MENDRLEKIQGDLAELKDEVKRLRDKISSHRATFFPSPEFESLVHPPEPADNADDRPPKKDRPDDSR